MTGPSRRTLRFGDAQAARSQPLVAQRRGNLREQIARVVRQYVLHRDRSAEDNAAFRAWVASYSTPLVRVLGTTLLALLLLSWPGDLRFRGGADQPIFDAFLVWRIGGAAVLAPLIVVHKLPLLARRPLLAGMLTYVAFVALVAYAMGRIGNLDAPWFYALYGCAWLTVVFPFGPLARLGWVLVLSCAGPLTYFMAFPEHFAHPHVEIPLINLMSFSLVAVIAGHVVHHLVRENFFARRALDAEHTRAEALLHNMLPETIASRLKRRPGPLGDRFVEATVMFADIVDFTRLASRVDPERLLVFLNDLFTTFDLIAERHGLEKIKTVGDSYVVAGGLPTPRDDHAAAVADMALEMMATVGELRDPDGQPVQLRIGIETGAVVAGVIGVKKLTYDLWGDTVNMASRLESHGVPGRIQIGAGCYECLRDHFELEPRGVIDVKGKGEVATYFLVRAHRESWRTM